MLQFITNAQSHDAIVQQVQQVLDGGCKWIQLRMKGADRQSIMETAKALKPMCKDHEAILVVDDEVQIAKDLELDGVHLGKHDMDPLEARELLGSEPIIGATANTFDDIKQLPRVAIDYIGLGPYHYTTTKQNLSPVLGLEGYREIVSGMKERGIELPIVAIGGICHDDIAAVMQTGVDGIALSGSILRADDPSGEMERTIEEVNKYKTSA